MLLARCLRLRTYFFFFSFPINKICYVFLFLAWWLRTYFVRIYVRAAGARKERLLCAVFCIPFQLASPPSPPGIISQPQSMPKGDSCMILLLQHFVYWYIFSYLHFRKYTNSFFFSSRWAAFSEKKQCVYRCLPPSGPPFRVIFACNAPLWAENIVNVHTLISI